MPWANLWIFPRDSASGHIVCEKDLLRVLARDVLHTGRIKSLTLLKPLRFLGGKVCLTLFQRHKIEQMRRLIIGRREPVGRTSIAGTHLGSTRCRLHVRPDGPALAISASRPIEFFYEWNSRKKLPTGSVKNV